MKLAAALCLCPTVVLAQNVGPPVIPPTAQDIRPLNNTFTGSNTFTGPVTFSNVPTFPVQALGLVFAGPASGPAAAPTFRALVASDIPVLNQNQVPIGPMGLLQNGLGSPGGTMTGYVAGDSITLKCTGLTFTQAPIIAVLSVTSGAVTGSAVVFPGYTAIGPIPGSTVSCQQNTTSGTGTGYTVTVNLGPIAAYVPPAQLGTGGGAVNGNLFLNTADLPPTFNAGAENTFIGDKAGFGLPGLSSFNVAIGHNAGGYGNGTTSAVSSYSVYIGNDAGRNITGNAAFGSNTIIGYGSGRNEAGGFNTWIGSTVASSGGTNSPGLLSGSSNTGIGYQVANGLTSGVGNTLLGQKAGSALVAGSGNLILSANAGTGDVCANGDTLNDLRLCSGQGLDIEVIPGSSDVTTSIMMVAGNIQASHMASSAGGGGVYVCIDSVGFMYKKASCP